MDTLYIAAVIPGRVTYNPECFDFLKQLQEKMKLVFFISINLPHKNKQAHQFIQEFNLSENQFHIEKTKYPEFIEKIPETQEYFLRDYTVNLKNMYSHYYHSKTCLDLVTAYETSMNMKFDGILKLRADILSTDSFTISHLQPSICCIPYGFDYLDGLNDNLAFGTRDVMKTYLSIVENFEIYMSNGIKIHPESILKHHLHVTGIHVSRFNFTYTLDESRFTQEADPSWFDPVGEPEKIEEVSCSLQE